MTEIGNKFLLAGDKFMPEMHIVLVDHSRKTKKEYKSLKKQEIHDIFINTNSVKLVFNLIWFMDILKI